MFPLINSRSDLVMRYNKANEEVECFFLKPYWLLYKISYLWKKRIKQLYTAFSRNFENTGKTDTGL